MSLSVCIKKYLEYSFNLVTMKGFMLMHLLNTERYVAYRLKICIGFLVMFNWNYQLGTTIIAFKYVAPKCF